MVLQDLISTTTNSCVCSDDSNISNFVKLDREFQNLGNMIRNNFYFDTKLCNEKVNTFKLFSLLNERANLVYSLNMACLDKPDTRTRLDYFSDDDDSFISIEC